MTSGGWAMMIVWTLLLVLLAAGLLWAILAAGRTASTQPRQSDASARSARELLDERLATGEIDIEEYQRRRQALE